MLPRKPFSRKKYLEAVQDFDTHWNELVKREHVVAAFYERLKDDKFLQHHLENYNVPENHHQLAIKQGLFLLFSALGPLISKSLLDYQPTMVVLTALNLVVNLDFRDPEIHLSNTTAISVLCELSLDGHPTDPTNACLNLLNHLSLPLYIHQSVMMNVNNLAQERIYTRH